MEYYKREIDLNKSKTIINTTGGTETLPRTVQIFLTQNIEDIGIYDDTTRDADGKFTTKLDNKQ